MQVLIVVDMQKDFISGALGTPEAEAIVPNVIEKIAQAKASGTRVVFTRDTHQDNYLQTQEGRNLPVVHCLVGTDGWQIDGRIDASNCPIFDKPAFGSEDLVRFLKMLPNLEQVELIGLCTDICVISNAMLIKSALPELPIAVDSACCAGVTPQSHENALQAMKMCQIDVK